MQYSWLLISDMMFFTVHRRILPNRAVNFNMSAGTLYFPIICWLAHIWVQLPPVIAVWMDIWLKYFRLHQKQTIEQLRKHSSCAKQQVPVEKYSSWTLVNIEGVCILYNDQLSLHQSTSFRQNTFFTDNGKNAILSFSSNETATV